MAKKTSIGSIDYIVKFSSTEIRTFVGQGIDFAEVSLSKWASIRSAFKLKAKTMLLAIDKDAVALNLSVWILIEVSLCVWNRAVGDFVAKFVDVELLIAQFVATLIVWFVSLAMAFKEAQKSPQKTLDPKSTERVLMIKEEASKVPIFFAAAIMVSVGCKILALFMNWAVLGFPGLYVAIAWLVGAALLLLFAGMVRSA